MDTKLSLSVSVCVSANRSWRVGGMLRLGVQCMCNCVYVSWNYSSSTNTSVQGWIYLLSCHPERIEYQEAHARLLFWSQTSPIMWLGGGGTVLVKSRTLPWWLGGEAVKTTENKIDLPQSGHLLKIRMWSHPVLFATLAHCAYSCRKGCTSIR